MVSTNAGIIATYIKIGRKHFAGEYITTQNVGKQLYSFERSNNKLKNREQTN